MSDPQTEPGTPVETQYQILADVWTDYRDEEAFADLVEYADLALPIAFAVTNDVAAWTARADGLIAESFSLLLETLGLDDAGYSSLDELLAAAREAGS